RVVPLVDIPSPCKHPAERITWIGPQGASERSRLAAWCQSVGRAAIGASEVPGGDDDIAQRGLVVATWNIHGGAADFGRFATYVRSWAAANASAPPHIVVLAQEAVRKDHGVPSTYPGTVNAPRRIGPREARTDIEATAEGTGMWLAYIPSMRNGRGQGADAEDRGSAVLSTL